MRTRLVLIRHGHAAADGERGALLAGRTDLPLSPRGRAEIRRLLARLRGTPPFAAIYSSPLRRARETATPLSNAGMGVVSICPALQEVDCGVLDGLPLAQVERGFPGLWKANLEQTDEHFRWPGGESYREFRCRCVRALRSLAGSHRGERIALVTHAGVVSQILGFCLGAGPAEWGRYRPGNTALTELDWARGAAAVVSFDDRAHLALEAG